MPYRTIVVGTDGSELASSAERVAASLARSLGATLLIVHAADRPERSTAALQRALEAARAEGIEAETATRPGDAVTLVFAGHPKTGELVLHDTAASLGNGADMKLRIEDGDPGDRIMEVAAEEGADLIVVGNRGMAGAKSFFLGSAPGRSPSMRRATC